MWIADVHPASCRLPIKGADVLRAAPAADVASVAAQLLQRQPAAGASLLAHLMDRAVELLGSKQEGAAAQLDGVLSVLVALAGSSGDVPAVLLLYVKVGDVRSTGNGLAKWHF